jgi:hypothetical protein
VCSQLDSRVLGLRDQYELCVSEAVSQSVAKVDNARLTVVPSVWPQGRRGRIQR